MASMTTMIKMNTMATMIIMTTMTAMTTCILLAGGGKGAGVGERSQTRECQGNSTRDKIFQQTKPTLKQCNLNVVRLV